MLARLLPGTSFLVHCSNGQDERDQVAVAYHFCILSPLKLLGSHVPYDI